MHSLPLNDPLHWMHSTWTPCGFTKALPPSCWCLSLWRINEKRRIWCFMRTLCLISEATVCRQWHNDFLSYLSLTQIIRCQYFLLCKFKIRLFIVIVWVGVRSVSYRHVCGELVLQLAKRQMLHCQIPPFRWTQAFCLLDSVQNASLVLSRVAYLPTAEHNPREFIWGHPHPFTSQATWLNDLSPFKAWLPHLLPIKSAFSQLPDLFVFERPVGKQQVGHL